MSRPRGYIDEYNPRALRCDVCRQPHRALIGRGGFAVHMCNGCFERLDQLDTDHPDPAFCFAVAVVANREAARVEGVA